MTKLKTMTTLGVIILLIMTTVIPTKVILGEKDEVELTQTEQETYNLFKEMLFKELSEKEGIVQFLGIHGIRELLEEVMSEPYIMKQFQETLEQLTGKGELSPSLTKYLNGLEDLRVLILKEMTQRMPTE